MGTELERRWNGSGTEREINGIGTWEWERNGTALVNLKIWSQNDRGHAVCDETVPPLAGSLQVAAVFSVSTLTWSVVSDSGQGQPPPDSEPSLVQAALEGE